MNDMFILCFENLCCSFKPPGAGHYLWPLTAASRLSLHKRGGIVMDLFFYLGCLRPMSGSLTTPDQFAKAQSVWDLSVYFRLPRGLINGPSPKCLLTEWDRPQTNHNETCVTSILVVYECFLMVLRSYQTRPRPLARPRVWSA